MSDPIKDSLALVAVFALVALNAFFVAAEFALASLNAARIDQLASTGNKAALRVQRARQSLDTCLAGTQLGVTMASLALGSIGEPAMARLLLPLFLPVFRGTIAGISANTLAIGIGFALVTSLHIIMGELVPKSVAFQRADAVALRLVPVMNVYIAVFRPFIVTLNYIGNTILRRFGLSPVAGHNAVHSVEELEILVHSTKESGALDEQQEQMVSGVFDFRDTVARKVMTPRLDMTAVNIHCPTEELLRTVIESGHSRLPVYENSLDDIKGVIHVKDVLIDVADGTMDATIADLMRKPYFVPENKRASHLLAELRRRKSQMAIVLDEYGVVSGIVTIEDLLEEIVGDIQDEYDEEETPLTRIDAANWLADGALTLDELEERLDMPIVREDETQPDTIGGLVFELLGHQPEVGETARYDGLELRVEATDGRRVQKVRVTRLVPETAADSRSAGAETADTRE